jgi:hypothetical protein
MAVAWETYTVFARSQLRRMADRIMARGRKPVALRIDVLTGLHAGTSTTLPATAFAIGPDPTHDVMLIDDALMGAAASFTCQMSLFGPLVSVITDRSDVVLNGTAAHASTLSAPERLPCDITMNGIHLRLHDATARHHALRQRAAKLGPALLVSLGGAAFAAQLALNMPSHAPVSLATAPPVANQANAPMTPIKDVVTAMIAKAGLADHLQVTSTATDAVNITGNLPAALMPDWHRVRQDIDQITSGHVVVARVTQAPQLAELPPIAAVRLGSVPSIVFANGDTATMGDTVAVNWMIDAITADQITLQRNGETVVVSF